MVVGFFSDDGSALYAALLASCALASVDRDVTLVEWARMGPPSPGPADGRSTALPAGFADALAPCPSGGRPDIAVVGPLGLLLDAEVASLLDVAVVSGADPVHALRARRSAAPGRDGPTPTIGRPLARSGAGWPWYLPFGAGRSEWDAAPVPRRRGPSAARTLPVRVPLAGRSVEAALELGIPTLDAFRIGIMLAATLEVAAADPDAMLLGAAAMADLMRPGPHPADRALAARLCALAARLDDIERAAERSAAAAALDRSDRRRRRLAVRSGSTASLERPSNARGAAFRCR